MKLALITDTHFGVRNDSQILAEHIGRFYKEIFFPTLEKLGIKRILHLGDIMDRRKFLSYLTLSKFREQFLNPVITGGYELDVVIGNHDTFYKNTNSLNCMGQLLEGINYDKIRWHEKPTTVNFDGLDILLVPWMCTENVDLTIKAIDDSKSLVAMGHLELAGFEMYRGSVSDHGYDPKMFDKFEMVCTGHYHHKSTRGNINYLGSPYEMTWSDYADARGFHIFDTETRTLEYIQNPLSLFVKLVYDDSGKDNSYILNYDVEKAKGCFVKLVVKSKNNPYWFDILAEKLTKIGVADLQIVEDHLNLDLENDQEIIDGAEDTLSIIKKFAAQQNIPAAEQTDLVRLLGELYAESLTLEVD